VQDAIGVGPYTSSQSEKVQILQDAVENGGRWFCRKLISDEATFHISGKVNRHNVRIWGTEQPYAQIEHQRDSVSLLCGVPREIARPIFPH
jgi:hypothetical protein